MRTPSTRKRSSTKKRSASKRETAEQRSAVGSEGDATTEQRSEPREAGGGSSGSRRSARRRALLLSPGQLWGLRFMALGGVLVLAALIGGFVLLVGGDDDDDESAQAIAERSGLSERVTKQDAGLSVFYPGDWRRSEREGIINLESSDRCVAVSLSAPVEARLADQLFLDSLQSLRDAGEGAQVGRPKEAVVVGGKPTRTAIAALRSRRGAPVTVRLSVSKGPQIAHVLQVVTRAPNCETSVQQSRAIVESIQYTR